MEHAKVQGFKTFLTERFTALAVEVFGEVESMMEACYEENKRLRNMLHMVLSPELKLPRIGQCFFTAIFFIRLLFFFQTRVLHRLYLQIGITLKVGIGIVGKQFFRICISLKGYGALIQHVLGLDKNGKDLYYHA